MAGIGERLPRLLSALNTRLACAACLFSLAHLAYAQTLTVWDGSESSLSAWSAPTGLRTSILDGRLCLNIEQPDSRITRSEITWTPSPTDTFVISYRAEGFTVATTAGEIFYQNDAHAFADTFYVNLPSLVLDGRPHELVVPVRDYLRSGIGDWVGNGPITSLRMDLVDQAPGRIEIESILLSASVRGITLDEIEAAAQVKYLFPTNAFTRQSNGAFERNVILPEGEYTVWAHFLDTELGQRQLNGCTINGALVEPPALPKSGQHAWAKAGSVSGGPLRLGINQPPSVLLDAMLVARGAEPPHDKPLILREAPASAIMPSAPEHKPGEDETLQPRPTECVSCEFRDVVNAGENQEVTLVFRSETPVSAGEVVTLRACPPGSSKALHSVQCTLIAEQCTHSDDGMVTVTGLSLPISRWLPSLPLELRFELDGRQLTKMPANLIFAYHNDPPRETLESHVDASGNVPRLVVNGKPIYPLIGNAGGRDIPRTREAFKRANFNIESSWIDGLGSDQWWVGPDAYDFTPVDAKIVEALDFDPALLVLPIVWAAPPDWWKDVYPDEMARFSDGTTWNYYRSAHSFSSEIWKRDAAAALSAFVHHVESMPYASRVLGYWIIGGVSAEWQGWGCHASHENGHLMDYSPPAQAAFRAFLQRAHPDRAAQFATAQVPSIEQRLASELGMFRDPAAAQMVIDYDAYYSESVVDGMLHCLHAVKESCGRKKITGVYFGYSMEYANMSWAHHMSGHNSLRKALDSPDIDFFSAPPSYAVRKLGEDQSWMWPFRAMQKAGKLVWVDDDTRTYLSGECGYSPLINPEETREGLRRNFAKVLCRLCPLGYLPIESGLELDDAGVAHDIRIIRRAGELALANNVERHPEIAVVIDEDSVKYLKYDAERLPSGEVDRIIGWNGNVANTPRSVNTLTGDLISYQRDRIARIGAPVDYLLFSDLPKYEHVYKLFIMLSCLQYDEAELQAVRDKLQAKPATVLWCYAPGFIHEGTATVQNMEALTGISLAMLDAPSSPQTNIVDLTTPFCGPALDSTTFGVEYAFAPLFHVVDDRAMALGRYCDTGKISLAVKQVGVSTSIFCGSNKLSAGLLHSIAGAAGVHLYSDSLEPCDANDRFVYLHSSQTGPKAVALRQPGDVIDVYEGKLLFENVDHFTIDMPLETTKLFYIGDGDAFMRFMDYPSL